MDLHIILFCLFQGVIEIKRLTIVAVSTALAAVATVSSAYLLIAGLSGQVEAKSVTYTSKAVSLGKIAVKALSVPSDPSVSSDLPPIANENSGSTRLAISESDLLNNLMLVNSTNPLPSDYIPGDLISYRDETLQYKLPSKNTNLTMDRTALHALTEMFKAAESAGISDMLISNGYRSIALQDIYFTRKVNAMLKTYGHDKAIEQASAIVAPPGKSEHHTGLAVDITTRKLLNKYGYLSQSFAETAEGRWLAENSWKYGFVLRYKSDKSSITGIINEPWHFRYVGKPHAEIMYWNDLCLEEYLQLLEDNETDVLKAADGKTYEIRLDK